MVGDSCAELTSPNACDRIVQACCKEGVCACDETFVAADDGRACVCPAGMTLDMYSDMCVPGKSASFVNEDARHRYSNNNCSYPYII